MAFSSSDRVRKNTKIAWVKCSKLAFGWIGREPIASTTTERVGRILLRKGTRPTLVVTKGIIRLVKRGERPTSQPEFTPSKDGTCSTSETRSVPESTG